MSYRLLRSKKEIAIELTSVSGNKIKSDPIRVENNGDTGEFEGTIENMPEGAFIRVAVREPNSDIWHFFGPAILEEEEWKVSIQLSGENKHFDRAICMVVRGEPVVSSGDLHTIQTYALASTPLIRIESSQKHDVNVASLFQSTNSASFMPNLIPLFIVLAILVLLEVFFEMISTVFGTLKDAFKEIIDNINEHFQALPKPDSVHSVLGIVILGLGLYAIWNYFGIYSHILEEALNLRKSDSQNLAIMLITFVGLAGLVFDVTEKYGGKDLDAEGKVTAGSKEKPVSDSSDKQPSIDNEIEREVKDKIASEVDGKGADIGEQWQEQRQEEEQKQDSNQEQNKNQEQEQEEQEEGKPIVLLFLIAIITFCLWAFQAALYYNFYSGQTSDPLVARAMGAAAFFIAGIETLVFYWATKLGLNFYAWLLFQLVILLPLGVFFKVFEIFQQMFEKIPKSNFFKSDLS